MLTTVATNATTKDRFLILSPGARSHGRACPGLSRPSTSCLLRCRKKYDDARDKRGHDGGELSDLIGTRSSVVRQARQKAEWRRHSCGRYAPGTISPVPSPQPRLEHTFCPLGNLTLMS